MQEHVAMKNRNRSRLHGWRHEIVPEIKVWLRHRAMKKSFPYRNDQEWQICVDYLLSIRNTGNYQVTIEKYRKKRSLTANAYYWSVCIPTLAEHFGYRHEEMHTAILGTYTGWEERSFRGHTLYVPRRTSTTPDVMDTMDFQGLIQTAQQIAAEEGIILPDQESQGEDK